MTTVEGLAGWWTSVSGEGLAGGELRFTFGPGSRAVTQVDAAKRRVRWTPLACVIEDRVGTTIHFDVEATPAGGNELRFRHAGLTPRLECFTDCKSGWDHVVPSSLRTYVETGIGNPNGSDAYLGRREVRARRPLSG